ncbi:diphthine--ammonia ligase [Malassezia yamatoensis]|uniref:Diphthine--ammonia ligase n=1 Tax=Malassezia yamatoensis TaxID=253288 RepID=A0AAJ5YSB5_9BASI|nr:diphthine--ammonia ligase [Malassezia yamatoensis]
MSQQRTDHPKMKVVGLLSGGKDSCYNLCHCVLEGHEIVALATLVPPTGKGAFIAYTDEVDSYMYQTVGHDAVHYVAQAMNLPLYRAQITGTAVNQDAVYSSRNCAESMSSEEGDQAANSATGSTSTSHDETEDMYRLLKLVKTHHPEIEAVSVGAILSNYQRVRVEHVVLRHDVMLEPLAYLWERNQSHLLQEMVESGLNSVLLKVAGIGLTDRDLGKSLMQMQPKLEQLHALYGAHVCGEGGEYETLTLDSPLFQSRIELKDTETVLHSDAAFASVSYLRVKSAELIAKSPDSYGIQKIRNSIQAPELYDALGQYSLTIARQGMDKTNDCAPSDTLSHSHAGQKTPYEFCVHVSVKKPWIYIGDITGPSDGSFEQEVLGAFEKLWSTLETYGYDMSEICHINVSLKSQTLFPILNKVYKTQFGAAPPSRACVAIPLASDGARVVLDITAFKDCGSHSRRVLHVQSRSFWAPANIGPYSQAVSTDDRIWIAGQIGMIPASLCVPNDISSQIALSLQHVRRIILAVRGWSYAPHEAYVEGGICWVATTQANLFSRILANVWNEANTAQDLDSKPQHAHQQIDDESVWLGESRNPASIPLLVIQLAQDALPKQAAIEWQLTANTGRSQNDADVSEQDSDTNQHPSLEAWTGSFVKRGVHCSYRVSYHPQAGRVVGVADARLAPHASEQYNMQDERFCDLLETALQVRIVHSGKHIAADGVFSQLFQREATSHISAFGWALIGERITDSSEAIGIVYIG